MKDEESGLVIIMFFAIGGWLFGTYFLSLIFSWWRQNWAIVGAVGITANVSLYLWLILWNPEPIEERKDEIWDVIAISLIIIGPWLLGTFLLSLIIPWVAQNWLVLVLIGVVVVGQVVFLWAIGESGGYGEGKMRSRRYDTKIYGAPISSKALSLTLPTGEVRCNLCGVLNNPRAKFCKNCGHALMKQRH